MKVLQLFYRGLAGGALKVCLEESIEFNKAGHETVVLQGFPIPIFEGFIREKIPIYTKLNLRFPNKIFDFVGSTLCDSVGIWSPFDFNLPENFKPDWIISHYLTPLKDAFRLAQKYHSRIAVVIHADCHMPNPFLRLLPRSIRNMREKDIEVAKKLLKKVDLVVAVPTVKTPKWVETCFNITPKILPLGCTPSKTIPNSRGDYILCVSRLSLGKRIHEVARSIAYANRSAPVIFAGSTHATTGEVIRRIRATKLNNYRIFQNVSNKTLTNLYQGCRMHVSIGALLPIIEAASHGAPIICDAVSGASYLFRNNIHGFILSQRDIKSLTEFYSKGISDLLSDDIKAWRMGYAAWKLCKDKYTWYHHSKKMIDYLIESS